MTRSLLSALTMLAIAGLCHAAQPASSQTPEQEANEAIRGDFATKLNDAIDSKDIYISSRMYRAIQAVERYRQTVQRGELSPSERDLDNFNLSVRPANASDWVTGKDLAGVL